jgi:RNA polymerase sigma factor (sigma-70 family)
VSVHGAAISPRGDPVRPAGGQERELLGRVARRDLNAFEKLYRMYQPRLERFLTSMLRRPQLVEEVVNDTMMVVWQTAGSFRGASKLSTWVFSIAYRKALKARSRWPEPVVDEQLMERVSTEPLPDQEIHQQRLHEALVTAMDKLSTEQRAVVDLTYFHGLGYREIAAIVDCPVDTVKTRMFHARRRLRQALAGGFADWI